MKPFQRLKAVICFFICITYFSISGNASNNPIDTIVPPTNHYSQSSYRLTITSIKVEKTKGNTAKIVYNLSNSGLNPIKLGKGRTIPKNLVFEFDESISQSSLVYHASAVASAIRNQKMTLRTGQLLMGNKLKVNLDDDENDMVIVIKDMPKDNPKEVLVETTEEVVEEIYETSETVVETPSRTEEQEVMEETISETVVETSSQTEEQEIVEVAKVKEPVITKMPPLENTETIILNTPTSTVDLPKIETVEITEEKVEEVKTTPEITVTDLETSEEQVAKVPVEQSTEIPSMIETKEQSAEIASEEVTMNEVMEPIVSDNEIEEEEETEDFADAPHYEVDLEAEVKDKDFLEEDICADLVMESVRIIKQSKNSVTLEYVVANYGNGSAALFGESKKDDDNVAIKAHLSKSRKLTRGSIPLKGSFISKGVKNKSGMLLPKQRVTNTMKLDVSKMTKFTPVLILSLDGFQDVQECDEMNNIVFINLIEVNKVAYAKPSRPKSETKVLSKVDEK